MPSKTISLSLEAYERLNRHRRGPDDSFSRIVMRARWEEDTITAGELLKSWEMRPALYDLPDLDRIEAAKAAEPEAIDKWTKS